MSQSNPEDSQVRALSALEAFEDERIAREAELAARDGRRVRMARGTGQQLAVAEETLEEKVKRLAVEAEAAVDRYTAAEEALELVASGDAADEELAEAQANLQRLMQKAEAAVDGYDAANAELERATEAAKAAAAQPIPLSRDVWPTAPVVQPEPDLVVAVPAMAKPRSGARTIVGIVMALGVVVVAVLAIRAAAPSGTSTTTSDKASAPIPAAAPAAAPALTPAEKARQQWEREQAAREAADTAKRKRKRKRTSRPKPIDPNSKVKIKCDPRDPLCGV